MEEKEFKELVQAAREAIKNSYGAEDGEYGSTLFVSHHIEEINQEYWKGLLGVEQPSPEQILNTLVLQFVEENEEIESLDFTLPNSATNYVLAVYLNDDKSIDEIAMES